MIRRLNKTVHSLQCKEYIFVKRVNKAIGKHEVIFEAHPKSLGASDSY